MTVKKAAISIGDWLKSTGFSAEKTLSSAQEQRKNLLQQMDNANASYLTGENRGALQNAFSNYQATMNVLRGAGYDIGNDVDVMRGAVHSSFDFQNQFKDENDFNVSYAYPKKYKGKTRTDVNAALTQLKNTPGAEAEYDWLNKNQMNYWSADELKAQIGAWQNEISGIERQRRNMPRMAAGSTDADYAKRQQEALALSGQIDERKAKIGKAQSLLTRKTYDDEISKWDTQMQRALSDYSKALSVSESANTEMAMAGNSAFVVQNSDYAKNARNTVRSFEQQLRDYGYSDQQINGIRNYALTQQHANEAAEMAQQVAQEAKEHPWLSSAMSVGTNMMAGAGALDIAAQNALNGTDPFTGEKMAVDRYTKSMVPSTVTNTIRGSVSEDMSGIGSFLYNTGMSMADSLATLAVGGATGLHGAADVILGGAAASQAITDAYDRGASDSQAMSVGLLYGTAEALFEHISLDKLRMFHTSAAAGKKTAKTLVKDMLKQSFVEGSEEVCTDIANVISDAIVMADKSEINQTIAAYQADGMSEDEATRRAWLDWLGQTAQDFAGGMISGGVMTGGDMALNAGMRSANYREAGRQITANDYADILRHAAEESGDENLRKMAGKKQTNRNTGKLYEATQEANLTQAVSDRLGALGTPENDVQELTGLVVKQIKGQELTGKEQRKFDASKQAQRAANEYASLFTSEADRTTNAWARSHMRDAAELERNAIYGGARKTDAGQTQTHQAKNAEVQVNGETAQVQALRYDQESGSVELSVKAKNGDVQRVSVKDAKLPEGTRLLAESAEKYGETAPQMYANYQNGQDVERYASAYEVAYSYGRARVKNYAVLENSGAASYLTPEQRKFAYETGLAAARRESDAKSAAAKSGEILAGSVTLEGGKLGNVTLAAVNTAGLTRKQTASIDVARKVAEATGVNVVFFESQTGEDGKYLGMNGAYRDGTIYLDVNAGKNNVDTGETAILKTMSHELTHFIQQNSGQYEALKEFVANHVLESGDSIERLARQKLDNDSTGELTMDGAMDEVVADACEMMLRNTEAVQRLANENRSLAEKIRDWIGDFVKKLRDAFKGDRATHDEARAMLDRMVELQKLWDDALVDAAKTRAAKENAADHGDVQHSIREEFSDEIDDWARSGMRENEQFVLGSTGPVLQGIGAIESDIFMNGDKIKKILTDHPEMTLAEIKKIPKILEDPAIVLKSKTRKNSIVVFGTYKAVNQKPFLASMDLRPMERGFAIDDMQKVTSAYTKTETLRKTAEENGRDFLLSSEVLFADKKRTASVLRPMGIYAPMELLRSGYVGSITYRGGKVNIEGVPFSSVFRENGADGAQFSLREPVEQVRDLVAVHGLTEQNLRGALALGGLPMPSIAVVKAAQGHSKYGPISMVFGRESIDPQVDPRNKIYGGDAYTPTAPAVEYPVNYDRMRTVEKRLARLSGKIVGGVFRNDSALQRAGVGEESGMSASELADKLSRDDSVRAAYLADRGETLEPVMQAKEFNRYGNDALAKLVQKIGVQELAHVEADMETGDYQSAREIEDTVRQIIRDSYEEQHRRFLDRKPELKEKRLDHFMDNNVHTSTVENFIRDAWAFYEDQGATADEVDRLATSDKLHEATDTEDVKAWLLPQLKSVFGEPGIYNGKERYTASGDRRSFSQLHWEYTLENIVSAMAETQKERGGQTWGTSAGAMQAVSAEDFSSIDEVKAASGRLGKAEGEQYEAAKNAVENLIDQATRTVMRETRPHADNSFDEREIIGDVMMEAAKGKRTARAIQQAFAKEGYSVSEETALRIQEVYKAAAALPTEYFEAKPQRAVGFDEVQVAIVPDNINSELKEQLENMGVPVQVYRAGDEEQRLQILNSDKSWQFSERDDTRTDRDVLSDAADGDAANVRELEMLREYREKLQKYSSLTRRLEQQRDLAQNAESKEERLKARNRADNLAAQVSRADAQLTRMQNAKPLRELVARELKTRDSLAKENAMLRDRVEYWRGQTRRTAEATTDPKAVREAARAIIEQTSSNLDVDEVAGRLQELYDGIARGNEASYSEIRAQAEQLASDIVSDATAVDDEQYREYEDLRKYFKNQQLVVSAADRGDIPDFGDFRRRNMGRMRLKNGERTNVDQVYAELSEMYPEFFDQTRESQPSDQLYRIADVLDAVYAVNEYNPNAQYMREATQSVGNEILEQFFDLPQQRTFADRQAKKADQQKAHYLNQINELREANDTRIAELRAQNRERLQEAVAREREKRDEQIARLKEHYDERDAADKARREESAAVAKYRPRIERKAKRLSDWLLKNSDKEHIPEPLKLAVGEFLESIDFTSKRALDGGALTKKDIRRSLRYTDRMQKLLDSLRGQNDDGTNDLGLYLDIPDGFLEEMQKHINTASDIVSQNPGENVVNRMSGEQLQQLDQMLTILTRSIQNANKLKANAHFETARQAAQATVLELDRLGQAKGRTKAGEKAAGFFNWENTTPYYAFQRFGEGGKAIFEALSDGWDKMAFNTKAVMDFTEQTYTPKEVKAWAKETHTFKLESGESVRMTTAQMMAFYCLSKREQAAGHLLGGGMRVEDIQNSGRKENVKQPDPFLLTQEDIAAINGALTKRQREVADKLQKYMNDQGGAWGNRVSMERFGYRAFTEENYFPIETMDSDRDAKDPGAKENDMFRLLNMSATKSLVYKANNALVVRDIFDVFSNHMADMAKYDALALPILDAMKWYNYREKQKLENGHVLTTTVQRSIEKAYGMDANKYFTTFIKDLNGVNEGGRGEGFAKKMLSNYKVAAVAANLRVALLQPTAYVRAVGVMSPKYLAKAFTEGKSAYKEAEANSGIALWKHMGFYDTNIGRNIRDQIKNAGTWKDSTVEFLMKGAEWGDRLTWGRLWNACKAEVRDKQKLTGDALLKATAERFREVVYSTQVVDSTMTRSQAMRGKSVYGSISTAFMSEPTLSYNLVLKAYTDYTTELRTTGDKKEAWRNASGKIARALATYLVSATASGLVESIVDACRGDDEYATWWEKYLSTLIGAKYKDGKLSGVNPLESNLFMDVDILSKLPILKDFMSMISGYENDRMDTEWIKNLIDAYRIWDETIRLETGDLDEPTDVTYNGNMTLYGKIYKTLKAVSQATGLPISAASREVVTLWNTIAGAVGKGDEWTIHTYDSGPESQIKYGLMDGYLTREEAQQLLVEKGLADNEGDAYWKVDKWATGEGKYDEALAAVLSGDKAAFDAQAKELKEHGIGEKQLQSAVRSQAKEWYVGDDNGKRSITKEQALKILQQYGGKDADEAQKLVQKWTCEVVTGTDYDDIKDLYLDGKLTRSRAVDMLTRYGGMKQEDAQNKIDTADFVKAHPECDGISVEAVQKYNEQAKPAGLDAGTFWEAYQFKNDARTTRDSNGKAISGQGAMDKVTAYIDGLDLSREQKNALFLCFYSQKSLGKIRWSN